MADATVTSTLVTHRVVKRFDGLTFAYGVYDFAKQGVTTSTSLVIQMIPVPHGARILDMFVRMDSFATGGFVVGDSSLSNRFITTTSMSAVTETTFMNSGGGWLVSLSANAENSFDTIDLTLNGATSDSASGTIVMGVYYTVEAIT